MSEQKPMNCDTCKSQIPQKGEPDCSQCRIAKGGLLSDFIGYEPPRKEKTTQVPQEFIDAMNAQLAANEHKGGWKFAGVGWLMMEAVKNLGKLHEEICCSVGGTNEGIKRRAANIANFAMMIFDQVSQSEKRELK